MGDGRILQKPQPDATIPLKKSYRMSLISAGSISLDSTFKSILELYGAYLIDGYEEKVEGWPAQACIEYRPPAKYCPSREHKKWAYRYSWLTHFFDIKNACNYFTVNKRPVSCIQIILSWPRPRYLWPKIYKDNKGFKNPNMTDCNLKEKPKRVNREHPHLQNVNYNIFFFWGGGARSHLYLSKSEFIKIQSSTPQWQKTQEQGTATKCGYHGS